MKTKKEPIEGIDYCNHDRVDINGTCIDCDDQLPNKDFFEDPLVMLSLAVKSVI